MAERERRCDRPVMYQRWRDLLFLHYAVDPALVRMLVPTPLEVDTFPSGDGQESAWIGLVPFRMEGVRIRGLPAVPLNGAFPETNVRTYVHLDGRPGVWFFSLDAASWLACAVAQRRFHLPYRHATMTVARKGDYVAYRSRRRSDDAGLTIEAAVTGSAAAAEPGTLEFFLLERYRLYATDGNAWFAGNVHHAPYAARNAQVVSCQQSLIEASGLPVHDFTHRLFSEGVDVRIGALEPIDI